MSSKTILHYASYKISTQHRNLRILFDNCAQSSIISEDCAKELDLNISENPNQRIIVRTLTRNEPKPSKYADLKIDGIIFNFKVLDVDLHVQCPTIELQKICPSLEAKMKKEIEKLEFGDFETPLISNVTATEIQDKVSLKDLLIKQIESRVRWRESVLYMIDNGVNQFIEIGPGKVLSGLIKRIDKNVKISAINKEEDISVININD